MRACWAHRNFTAKYCFEIIEILYYRPQYAFRSCVLALILSQSFSTIVKHIFFLCFGILFTSVHEQIKSFAHFSQLLTSAPASRSRRRSGSRFFRDSWREFLGEFSVTNSSVFWHEQRHKLVTRFDFEVCEDSGNR